MSLLWNLKIFSCLNWSYSFGKEDWRHWVMVLSNHIKNMSQQYDTWWLMLIVSVDEVVFLGSCLFALNRSVYVQCRLQWRAGSVYPGLKLGRFTSIICNFCLVEPSIPLCLLVYFLIYAIIYYCLFILHHGLQTAIIICSSCFESIHWALSCKAHVKLTMELLFIVCIASFTSCIFSAPS